MVEHQRGKDGGGKTEQIEAEEHQRRGLGENSAAMKNRNTCRRADKRRDHQHGEPARLRERITRVPISAGTLQPKPIKSITKLRPSSPIRAISASMRKAARDK